MPPTHPGIAQLSPSATSVSLNLYELANGGHTVVYTKGQKKDLDSLPYMYGEQGIRAVSWPAEVLTSFQFQEPKVVLRFPPHMVAMPAIDF